MMKVIIVTGLSGSGKSTALHTLEDLRYYCIDNLPVFLLDVLVSHLLDSQEPIFQRTAVGIDARSATEGLSRLPALAQELRQRQVDCRILFLEAQSDTLLRRFNETRRKHPLSSPDRPLAEALELERRLLEPVLDHADLRIDTSHTNIYQLRDLVRERIEGGGVGVSVLLESFGFKHGVPRDVDFVFDARCLPNPHWQPDLRRLTGRDAPVQAFLQASAEVRRMSQDLCEFFDRWVPAFEADGRSYLTIAVGCTGGQHRSVYLVEQLKQHFEGRGRQVLTRHRELS